MFIHSKFRDYYDPFIRPEERDPKVVYKRETKRVAAGVHRTSLCRFLRSSDLLFGVGNSHYVCLLLFCGRIYPVGITVSNDIRTPEKDRTQRNYKNPYAEFKTERYTKTEEAQTGQEDAEALMLNREVAPVILMHGDGKLTLNPRLEELEFPMNGSQAIQTIMGFLAPKDPVQVKTADKYRIAGHGFGADSFRREKGGPTRKRKKKG